MSLKANIDTKGVLKTLKKQDSAVARGRMQREVVALDTLATQGLKVPRVLDGNTELYGEPAVPLYFVMEYIQGKTLKAEIEGRGRQSLDVAGEIALELCTTVSVAHKGGVFHRDLKPDNIIVRSFSSADLVIVDYGLAFNQVGEGDGVTITYTNEQIRNSFMALPETTIPGGDCRDHRTDVAALCGILYFCLTGHIPGGPLDAKGRLPHRRDGRSVRQFHPSDPRCSQLEYMLDRGLAHEIDHRFQTVDDFTERVRAVLKPSDATYEDPAAVAKEIAADMRKRDRKTILDELTRQVSPLIERLQAIALGAQSTYRPAFQVSSNYGFQNAPPLPAGSDQIGQGITITLMILPHRYMREVVFTFVAVGNECALLRSGRTQKAGATVGSLDPWEQIGWVNPQEPPTNDFLDTQFKRAMSGCMRALQEEVYRENQSSG